MVAEGAVDMRGEEEKFLAAALAYAEAKKTIEL